MKLTKTASGYKLALSLNEWKSLGKKGGWLKGSQLGGIPQDTGVLPSDPHEFLSDDNGHKDRDIAEINRLMQEKGVTVEDLAGGTTANEGQNIFDNATVRDSDVLGT